MAENLEEEKNNLLKEKERLINSIERRKKLLSNENYISKAPQNIVEKEKSDFIFFATRQYVYICLNSMAAVGVLAFSIWVQNMRKYIFYI